MAYLGDYAEDYATLNFKFHTHKADGTPAALTSGAVSVYKGSATDSEVTTGVTLAANFDGVTGLNNVLIDLSSAAFYAVGFDYSVVITTGTVDSVSVIGAVVGTFSIENRFKEAQAAVVANNLDHLAKTATAAADMTTEVVDNSILSRILGNGDTSTFVPSTDGLHAAGVDIDAILADTDELQTEFVDGGRLDLILDAILLDTGTTLDGRIPAALTAGGMLKVSIEEIKATALTEGGAGRLAAAFIKLLDVATPLLVASDVMRGTDNAALEATLTAIKGAGWATQTLVTLQADTDDIQTRLPAALVAGKMSSTASVVLTAGDLSDIAEEILKYDWSGITGEADRSLLNVCRAIRNKTAIAGTTMTVYKENDSTPAWTAELTTSASAEVVVGIDPA